MSYRNLRENVNQKGMDEGNNPSQQKDKKVFLGY
jgi:hypothetical protein